MAFTSIAALLSVCVLAISTSGVHSTPLYTPFVRSGAILTLLDDWDTILFGGGRTSLKCPTAGNGCVSSTAPFYSLSLTTGQITQEQINVSPPPLAAAVQNGWLYCGSSGVDFLPQIDSIYFSTVLGVARLPRNSTTRKFGDLKLTTQVNITGLTRGGSLTWQGSLCSQLKFEARGGHEEHFWVHGGFSSATVNTQVEPFYVWLSPLAPVANMWHMSTSNTANLDVLPTVGGPEFPEDPFGFSTAASVTTTDANSNFNAYYYYNASSQSQALMLYLPFRTTFNYNWTNASSVVSRLPPREYQSMAQDDTGSRIFIYGGRNPRDGTILNDLWVITTQGTNNYSAWQAMQVPIGVTANEPTGRFAASMVFDNKRSLLYIWGGETTTGFGDNRMYILKVQSNTGSGRTEWLETLPFNGSSSPTPAASGASPSGGVNVGAIAGGVAGGCVLLLVAGGAVFWMTRRKRTPTVQMKYSDETQSAPPLLLNSPVTSEQHSGRSLLPDHRSGNHSVAGSGTNRGSTAPTSPLFIAEEISTVDGQKITVLKPFTAAQQPSTPTDRYSDSSSRHSQGMSPITPQFVPQPPFSVPLRTTSVKLNAPQEPLMLTRGQTDYQSTPSITLSMAPGMIFTATDDYHPRMSDEILVKRGDVLVVLEVFNDGWTRVANRTTSATGFAPSVLLG